MLPLSDDGSGLHQGHAGAGGRAATYTRADGQVGKH